MLRFLVLLFVFDKTVLECWGKLSMVRRGFSLDDAHSPAMESSSVVLSSHESRVGRCYVLVTSVLWQNWGPLPLALEALTGQRK